MKKISENEYEIPIEGKMNVPGRIFADAKLISHIKQDKTLQQIKNVAMLPGILKNSLAMPDAHQGYGFCIGGVAAFDIENGVISPGGVGYDINCLSKDTKILTEFGSYIKIKDFFCDVMILIYVVCKDIIEAKDIGKKLLKKRLLACVNILEGMKSMYFWPPGSEDIQEADETILLIKEGFYHGKSDNNKIRSIS